MGWFDNDSPQAECSFDCVKQIANTSQFVFLKGTYYDYGRCHQFGGYF